jgi:hypothetical protein
MELPLTNAARIGDMDSDIKINYAMMVVFGLASVGASFAPVSQELRIAAVALFFGLTVGLWLSHLIGMLHTAVKDATR